MSEPQSKDRPMLRQAYDKLDDILCNIHAHPRLVPHERALRYILDQLRGVVAAAPSDYGMDTTVLDTMDALVEEVARMPFPGRMWVTIVVCSYIGEQLVRFHSLKSTRPFTTEEVSFGKERLRGLLDRLQQVIRERKGDAPD